MMDVAKELDDLCNRVAGCDLAVFADIGSKMVLATSSAGSLAQEDLDAVSEGAALMLSGAVAQDAARVAGRDPDAVELSVVMSGQEARVYVRSLDVPTEALVLVCRADVDLAPATDCAQEALKRIVAGGA